MIDYIVVGLICFFIGLKYSWGAHWLCAIPYTVSSTHDATGTAGSQDAR